MNSSRRGSFFKKLNTELPHNPAILATAINLKELKTGTELALAYLFSLQHYSQLQKKMETA